MGYVSGKVDQEAVSRLRTACKGHLICGGVVVDGLVSFHVWCGPVSLLILIVDSVHIGGDVSIFHAYGAHRLIRLEGGQLVVVSAERGAYRRRGRAWGFLRLSFFLLFSLAGVKRLLGWQAGWPVLDGSA